MLIHKIMITIKWYLKNKKNTYREYQKERFFGFFPPPPRINKMATTRKKTPRLAKYYQQRASRPKLLYARHY